MLSDRNHGNDGNSGRRLISETRRAKEGWPETAGDWAGLAAVSVELMPVKDPVWIAVIQPAEAPVGAFCVCRDWKEGTIPYKRDRRSVEMLSRSAANW